MEQEILTTDWLRQPPAEEEIEIILGIKVLRQRVIEEKLDFLTNQTWGTSNYHSKYFTLEGRMFISASLELKVLYGGYSGEPRTLVGAVTFPLDFFPDNIHYDNTAKSLCITNAASELGKQFGRGLNADVQPVIIGKSKRDAVLIEPDMSIKKSYVDAVANNNQQVIDHLRRIYKFPEPVNTY